MDPETIKAHLNLDAVLQNLEELVRLDPDMAALTRAWNVVIQFSVWQGPSAYVAFQNGVCKHGTGPHPNATVKLFFTSPRHLNRMFDGKAMPIPLRGVTRLGFLQKEFSRLTDRLAFYLKPAEGTQQDEHFVRVNTTLTLYTALYAVKTLGMLEPTCKRVAAHLPPGALEISVLPDGPCGHLVFEKDGIRAHKGPATRPMARMAFRNLHVANALLAGKLDAFLAVAGGDVLLQGQLPLIDGVNLILDRVPAYLG